MKKLVSVFIFLLTVVFAVSCTPLPEENVTDGSSAKQTENPEITVSGSGEEQNKTEENKTEENKTEENKTEENVTSSENAGVTVLGTGETKIFVDVVTESGTVNFEINTDSKILGVALTETGLVEGEEGPYGLYIKVVNGISAVYETDGAYWALNVNGVAAATGADSINIKSGDRIELVYTPA